MVNEILLKYRKVATGAMIVILGLICYQFSFKKTLEAILLNQKLKKEINGQDLGVQSSIRVMEQKQLAYLQLLKRYEVKKEERESRMWQEISGMALLNEVSISFQPLKAEVDTMLNKQQFDQEYQFNGAYPNLIKLLDTLKSAPQIGMIAKVKVFRDNKNPFPKQGLKMQLVFVGLKK